MKLTYGIAIREALYAELDSNSETVLLGQDIRHNVYGYTAGLFDKFGGDRVIDTPLSETAVVGAAIGAALNNMRVVVDLTVSNFLYVAMDQIVNQAAKMIYMYNGSFDLPLTIMCGVMYNTSSGAQHSDRSHPMLMNVPGLKIIAPATPQDAYSLLRAGIQDKSPVICFTDRTLFYSEQHVDLDVVDEIGISRKIKDGSDLTIISISGCLSLVKDALIELEANDLFPEVIDVRTLAPLDMDSIYKSVSKTGKVLIVDTAHRTCSAASEIAARLAQNLFQSLKAPIQILAYEDVPVPFAKVLEDAIRPTKEKIVERCIFLNSFNNNLSASNS